MRMLWAVVAVLGIVVLWQSVISPALATRLPSDLNESILAEFPDGKVRLDGSIQTSRGDLFLPLLPATPAARKRAKARIEAAFPSAEHPDLLVYGNGWCYLRVLARGVAKTVLTPAELPEKLKRQLLACKFPSDLIVPEHFVLPQSLKPLCADVAVRTVSDATLSRADFGQPPQTAKKAAGAGNLFVTSLNSGVIYMLDERDLAKTAEFPTEGTPGDMAYSKGRLYICDQTKNRILILDADQRQFLGQIDLPYRSAPKGIAVMPNGSLMYVSESGAGDIAVIEVDRNRVLMRTRVPPGPARIALTPNAHFLIVLNVPSGQVTVISTLNQKSMGSVQVGTMPSHIAISADSRLAYVSNRQSNSVSVVDIADRRVIAAISTGQGPTGVALSRDGSKLYVANARENSIAEYDTHARQKLQEVRLPLDIDFPGAIYLLPDGKRLLVTSGATDTIGVLDLKTFQFVKQTVVGHPTHEALWIPG
jgi:YVTN family beta-propeller protein